MLRRSQYIALVLVVLFVLALFSQSERTVARVKLAVSGLFLPLFGLAHSAQNLADRGVGALTPRSELQSQLESLQRENDSLRIQASRWQETLQENTRFREAFRLPKQLPWRLQLARVTGRDPANWWRNVRIDLGTRDGLTNHLPVITTQGYLVGRLSEVGYMHSQVALLGDPDCRVSVLVETTRDHGVITPSDGGPIDNTLVDLKFLSASSVLQPGQWVRTSGHSGMYPKGILVGQIADSRSIDFGLHLEARVKLAARLNELEEVMVVWP